MGPIPVMPKLQRNWIPTIRRTRGMAAKYFNSCQVEDFSPDAPLRWISGMNRRRQIRQIRDRTPKKTKGMRYPSVSATRPPTRGPNIMPDTMAA